VKEEVPDVQEEIPEDITPVEPQPEEEPVVSKVESPVVVKEKKEEVKPVEKPVEKTEEKKAEPKVEPKVVEKKVEEKPKVNTDAVYKPKATQGDATSKSTDTKQGTAGNHGDDPGKTGDKGDPKGTLNADALYGKPGGGAGGTSLDLAGWNWDEIPKPNVPNNITGRMVFEISVNARGELERIIVIENSLTPQAAKACREAVEQLTFTKTGTNVPALSKGKITFVVRSE
jgi:outer membrane biosynthesis protein TonB